MKIKHNTFFMHSSFLLLCLLTMGESFSFDWGAPPPTAPTIPQTPNLTLPPSQPTAPATVFTLPAKTTIKLQNALSLTPTAPSSSPIPATPSLGGIFNQAAPTPAPQDTAKKAPAVVKIQTPAKTTTTPAPAAPVLSGWTIAAQTYEGTGLSWAECVMTEPTCQNAPGSGQVATQQSCSWSALHIDNDVFKPFLPEYYQCIDCLNACTKRVEAAQGAISQARVTDLTAFSACPMASAGTIDLSQGSICCGGYLQSYTAMSSRTNSMLTAIKSGDNDTLIESLQAGADPNYIDAQTHQSALWNAVNAYQEGGNYGQVLQTLLDYGANPNTPTTDNVTPLMLAAQQGKLGAVQALVPAGGLAWLGPIGPTYYNQAVEAYQSTVKNGHQDIAQYLLENIPGDSLNQFK